MIAPSGDFTHEDVEALRPLAREKIKAGDLPTEPIPDEEVEQHAPPSGGPYVPGSKPMDFCRVCGKPIGEVVLWYRLPHPLKKPAIGAEPAKPELHPACYTAWRAEVKDANATEINLRLLAAPTDSAINSPDFQRTLGEFNDFLSAAGIIFQQRSAVFDAVDVPGYLLAEYTLKVAGGAILTLSGILIAWIRSRPKRGLVVKFGDVCIEAKRVEDVEQILQLIEEHRRADRARHNQV